MSAAGSVFIVSAKRTPFGAFCGKLSKISATDLAAHVTKATVREASVAPEEVDNVVFGNVIQSSQDAIFLARHAALKAGLSIKSTALTVNRMCGSGFQAVVSASQQILLGNSALAVAGGTENMTQVPFVVRSGRSGFALAAEVKLEDYLWQGQADTYADTTMSLTAELLGEKYGIKREECDEYSHRSQSRWRLAKHSGHFDAEIEPIEIKAKKGTEMFNTDEHPRECSLESLAQLKPTFKKGGLVTAGTASGITDGAAAVLLANDDAVKRLKLDPLVRVVGWHVIGCDPKIMGIGPVDAIRGLCEKTKVPLEKVDVVEINEAFAAQVLAVQKELGLDSDRLNLNGGAIAIGHPLGASGARITGHLAHEMK
ncbi:3-ketoacyl-CoA thiolase [Aphelenchoides avenae]|nr:3-ketoacyl-CoA thiolase [Aphelenchus avenae]